MRRLCIPVLVVVFIGLIFACAQKKTDENAGGMTPVSEETMPATVNAADVFKMMDENMAAYTLFPGSTEMMPGKSPHGAFVTVLVNDIALKSIEEKKATFDDESLIVKENYGADKAFGGYTIMYKEAGYYPEGGDWYWAKFDEKGTAALEGDAVKTMFTEKNEGCIACHAQVKDKDWVFTGGTK